MKRKGLLFVTLLLLLCVLSMCFVACNEPPHEHDYKMQTSDTMHWLKCDCGDTKDYNVHSGGTATCVSMAKCTTCNEEYGELGDHIYGEWKTNYNSTHSKVCIYEASHVITENCSGGTATEEERAICDICNSEYGAPLNHTHNFNKQEVKDAYLLSEATCEEKAEYYYSCKCGEKGSKTFEAGEPLNHNYGDWISNGDNTHTKTCANDNSHKITNECFGGAATCEEKAICTDCLSDYGEALGHEFKHYFSDNNATCEQDGTKTAICSREKCWEEDVITDEHSALGHSYGDWISNGDDTHTKTCTNDNSHKITNECFGGIATCTVMAICDDCNVAYGLLKDHETDNSGFCISCDKAINSTVGVLYELYSDGAYAGVVGYDGTSSRINIASTFKNVPVTTICTQAFYRNNNITKVIIPDSVTSINSLAFRFCQNLQSVTFGENSQLESIGGYAFNNCTSLKAIEIPNSVTSIGRSAFAGCGQLQSVTFGENSQLESIDVEAFNGCNSLQTIEIPSGVTSIGDYAVFNCKSLKSINVSEDNNTYKSLDGNLYSKDGKTLIKYAVGKTATSFTIPSSVTSISNSAFSYCRSLTSVTIGNGVTSIGYSAFSGCESLQSIEIPSSVTSIGNSAFSDCRSLTSVTIGNSVTSIGNSMFSDCRSLTSVTIGNSVTSIGNSAFFACLSLQSIEIPSSVTSIGEDAFSNCQKLVTIEIPGSVTSIGDDTFFVCSKLESINFGGTINQWKNAVGNRDIEYSGKVVCVDGTING